MAEIIFYEKPGCINGGKQKLILEKAGNVLQCRNILQHDWTVDKLLPFIQGKTPAEIMNRTAPAIKKGEIVPEKLDFMQAVELMVGEPILIKRPLIEVDGKFIQGFTNPELADYLGDWQGEDDVTTCPKLQTLSCDEEKTAGLPTTDAS